MRKKLIYSIILTVVSLGIISGQLSPGQLSSAHADLEGLSNCTKCHDLGKKVSSVKCLECHTEIQVFLDREKGFHASQDVAEKDCYDCHSEHHGRKFDMVRFDKDEFNHDLTSYKLEGEHAIIDCKACHKPDNIENDVIKSRSNTYLGLSHDCLSCHEDFHQNTLSEDCISCHDFENFSPAPNFDHANTDFRLQGAHLSVDCIECHPVIEKNGREFQEFVNIDFVDCVSCHSDPHLSHFTSKCNQCHTEKSFDSFIGNRNFNHNTTEFILKGKHQNLDCFSCHKSTSGPVDIFQDRLGILESECISCHTDVHSGKLGSNCTDCHSEVSFTALINMDLFDHNSTDFPLEGRHMGVECKSCHTSRYTEPLDFLTCSSCHSDYHRGEFDTQDQNTDCVDCHSLYEGFNVSSYSLDRHQLTSFPLVGSHIATPCFECHLTEERWRFKNLVISCIGCHSDIHVDYISPEYYPQQNCEACHNPEKWSDVMFDHTTTNWPLLGEHQETNCRVCHYKESNYTVLI